MTACPECGHSVGRGRFCGSCGQRIRHERFALAPLAREAVGEAFNVDRGFLHTVAALSTRPGAAVREYVAGRTRRYTNPVKYLLVSLALATLVGLNVGLELMQWPGLDEAAATRAQERAAALSSRFFNVILAGVIPFLALASTWIFRRAGFNAAEHLIFNTYVLAHQNLIFFVTAPLVFLPAVSAAGYTIAYTGIITAYYAWACIGFFEVGRWSGIWRGVATGLLAYLLYFAAAVGVSVLVTLVARAS